MLAKVNSCAIVGLDGEIVEVEVDISQGLPAFAIVGLPDAAVQEAKERVRSAIRNSGHNFPQQRITVNLAPADLRKEGPAYDLPIAVGILMASGQLPAGEQPGVFLGELSLDGKLRHTHGILPMVSLARDRGFQAVYVPEKDAPEAGLIEGMHILPVPTLGLLAEHLRAVSPIAPFVASRLVRTAPEVSGGGVDFRDIRGQEHVKRALEIAAAGGHNVLMTGPPGAGKTLLSRATPSILPSATSEEALEVTKIYSVAGLLPADTPVRERAQEEALSLASALEQGRVRIDDMVENTTPPLRTLYETAYRNALVNGRLSNVELLTNFPVATLAFGFTRGGLEPTDTTLVPFRDRGGLRAYGMQTKTEAILFQLDPVAVLCWLRDRGFNLPPAATAQEARLAILKAVEIPRPTEEHPHPIGTPLLTLLHSFGHRLVRVLAMTAGVERDGLAEYLLPHHLSIIVYASARGQFVLGALQAMFETSLNRLLDEFVHGEARCPLDPGCRTGGGACMACLHLGEPSCRWFNRFLDRAVLFGPQGYLAASRGRS